VQVDGSLVPGANLDVVAAVIRRATERLLME